MSSGPAKLPDGSWAARCFSTKSERRAIVVDEAQNVGKISRREFEYFIIHTLSMIIVLMGVTGSGKTTVGRLLAEDLGWTYVDADDFHSELNIEKMKGGIPLNDADRKPWLEGLRESVRDCLFRSENAVFACSALKESYREVLLLDERVKLVYLKGDYQVIRERLAQRRGHYMDPALLDSQFETLEEPAECLRIDASAEPRAIISVIRSGLGI